MASNKLSDELIIDLPEDGDLQVELANRIDGAPGGGVLAGPGDTVAEALEQLPGEAFVVNMEGSLGSGDVTVRLPKAASGERFVAIAIDDEGNPYLTGMGVEASEDGARLDLNLGAEEVEESALMISPGRVTKLWIKKVLHLPESKLGLFEIEEGRDGELKYTRMEPLQPGPRTALIVHGALSELRAMEDLSRYLMGDKCPRRYDRVVGFEYETVATPIRENGRLLADSLRDLRPDDAIDFFGYSTGTQVTRSFLQHEGGSDLASTVVMVAPPNAGTRLAEDKDRILKLGSMVLATTTGMLGWILGLLFRAVRAKDQGLDDLKPDSPFQRELAALEARSQRQHHAIAGVVEDDESSGRFIQRLLGTVASAYYKEQNDWVVPLSSTEAGPVHPPSEVACSHFGFFRDECRLIHPLLYPWLG